MHYQTNPSDSARHVLSRVRALANRQSRQAQQKFWIEGIRAFVQAFDAKLEFDTIVHSEILLKSSLVEKLARKLVAASVRRVRVTPEEFRAVSMTTRASGIGAIVRQSWTAMRTAEAQCGLAWLVVEQIRSSGNLGTILRTAEACGVGGIVFLGPHCDPFDPATVRASMGGIFHLRLVRTSHERFCDWARSNAVHIVGVSPGAPPVWTALPRCGPIAIVLGEERQGLSDMARRMCQTMVGLPMNGRVDSLNVGVAAGVVMFELARRRSGEPIGG